MTPTSPKPFPGFLQSLGLLGIALGFQVLAGIPVVLLKVFALHRAVPYAFLVGQLAAAAATLKVGASWGKRGLRDFLPMKAVPRRTWIPFFAAQIGLTLLSCGIQQGLNRFLPEPTWLKSTFEQAGPLSIVLGAALSEEPLFRGLILGGMLERYTKRKAILFSALLFVVMHGNPWQVFPPLMLGLFYGWLRAETRSLWLPMVGHALHNGLCVLVAMGRIPFMKGSGPAHGWLYLWGMGLLMCGVLGMLRKDAKDGARVPAVAS